MNDCNFFNTYVLRTPRFPFNQLIKALHDEDILDEWIRNIDVQEAIYLASPVLHKELVKYINKSMSEKDTQRMINSLSKYFSRMSTRCTPFGLFSGCSTGKITDKSDIILDDNFERLTRLDMQYLCELSKELCKKNEIKSKVKFYINNSIYKIGNQYRYVEYIYENRKRIHRIIGINSDEYINLIIENLKNGLCLNGIYQLLNNNFELEADEIVEYIDELISSQILVSEIDPSITGDDYLCRLFQIFENYSISSDDIDILGDIYNNLNLLDEENGNHNNLYDSIIQKVDDLSVSYDNQYLFQADMVKIMNKDELDVDVVKEVKNAIDFIIRIFNYSGNENLIKFQEEFFKRYDNEEISLSLALDPELGIGYPVGHTYNRTDLLRDFELPNLNKKNNSNAIFDEILLNKIIDAVEERQTIINIKIEDFKDRDKSSEFQLPLTYYAVFRVISYNNNNKLLALDFVGGSSGINLLSRFAYSDKSLEHFVHEVTSFEQSYYNDKVLMEIAHLPESRIGNILGRPHVREFEFVYLATSDLDNDKQIHLSDLFISIKSGKMIIRSKKMNCEVLPRLSTAHNYSYNSMPVYHFLCDMQFCNTVPGIAFDTSNLKYNLEYVPRIKYKNVILQSACWLIKTEELKILYSYVNNTVFNEKLNEWIVKKRLPKYVLLINGDNKLIVDFTSKISLDALYSAVKQMDAFRLEEFLYDDQGIVKDANNNKYLNEFIVVFKNNNNA